MFFNRSRVKAFLRAGLMLVLLLNACGPAHTSKKQPEATVNLNSAVPAAPTSNPARSLPTATPDYYNPPAYQPPAQTAPKPVQPTMDLPPEPQADPVEFRISASPAIVVVGNTITFEVRIRNNTSLPLDNLIYLDRLEKGLEFILDPSASVSFNTADQEVSYAPESLAAGQEIAFSYQVQVTEFNRSDQEGELWLHSVSLMDQSALALNTQATFVVGSTKMAGKSQVAAVSQDGGWASLGQLSVYMQQGSLNQDALLVASPIENPEKRTGHTV